VRFKGWYGLLMPNHQRGLELLRMEFRRFLHGIVLCRRRSCAAVERRLFATTHL
jgi:hypothetical protein